MITSNDKIWMALFLAATAVELVGCGGEVKGATQSGSAGASGVSGTSGTAGSAGESGSAGASGAGGSAGAGATAGAAGTAGSAGAGAVAGAAGMGGSAPSTLCLQGASCGAWTTCQTVAPDQHGNPCRGDCMCDATGAWACASSLCDDGGPPASVPICVTGAKCHQVDSCNFGSDFCWDVCTCQNGVMSCGTGCE